MFVRKKKNRSGTVSVVVADKSSGRFKELKTIGVSSDPDAEEMTIQLMGLIITFGEILAETVEYVIADETGTQSV